MQLEPESSAGDLASLSAIDLVNGYRSLDFTPLEATQAVLNRIEALDGQVHAYAAIDPAISLAAARASTRRYQDGKALSDLDGVPFGVKDTFGTQDFPTLMGSRARFDLPWLREDAPVVARLKDAGAVPMGKTATPELAFGGTTDNSFASTRNPWDTRRTSGGSSGGAGVAAALGMGPIQIGADAGGSIRVPAAFCGVVGLKPTHDRVPYWPWSPFAPLDHVGPLTRTVNDAALALGVIAQPDPRVPDRVPPMAAITLEGLTRGVKGWRIGVFDAGKDQPIDPEVRRLFDVAVAELEAQGAVCEPVAIDSASLGMPLLSMVAVGHADLIDRIVPGDDHLVGPQIVEFARLREQMSVADYAGFLEHREVFAAMVDRHFQRLDAIVSPMVPITAFAGGFPFPQDGPYAGAGRGEWTPFTYPFNVSRHPAISCPIGLSRSDGLPVAMQVVGPLYREDVVLRIARTIELTLGDLGFPPLL